jgi:hypothetical protein
MMIPQETEVLYRSRCGMKKALTAINAKQRSKFAALSPVMVTAAKYMKKCSGGYMKQNKVS